MQREIRVERKSKVQLVLQSLNFACLIRKWKTYSSLLLAPRLGFGYLDRIQVSSLYFLPPHGLSLRNSSPTAKLSTLVPGIVSRESHITLTVIMSSNDVPCFSTQSFILFAVILVVFAH
jgi:hypothetical protein